MQLVTPEGYISYPNLIEPKANALDKTKTLKYSVDLVFPKGTDLSELMANISAIAQKAGIDTKTSHICLKECATQIDTSTGKVKSIYDKGDYFIKAWCKADHPPELVGPLSEQNYPANKFRAGNKAALIINLYGGSVPSKYVSASLMACQWRGEGEPVGMASANINLFKPVAPTDMQAPTEGTDPSKLFG